MLNFRPGCQDLLTTENTDSDLKVHALHYANELFILLFARTGSAPIWGGKKGKFRDWTMRIPG